MKAKHLFIYMLGLLLFAACKPEAESNTKQKEKEHKQSTETTTDEAKASPVSTTAIVDSYLALSRALAADDAEKAGEAAKQLEAALKEHAQQPAAGQAEIKEILESAMEHARHIQESIDEIHHQREHLSILSQDIKDLLQKQGVEQKLYWAHCPMAFNNKGAYWISATEEIANPYMGAKMPACGRIESEINKP
ncbi:MAG: hypothetical protein KatS3mg033_1009 [Thermonema sp.]|jgi:hypothetical protein|uniref:DUF3347 domain-containing protein n=1 Tax=Thermonema sp. TaxID=2231181 RepID=UPI0021DE91F0|nr:DUF3347 domain-containing protein [Thermonema sp.]GIV39209.1 MAG: hypothetical protein KatS3mg033_1009 [Thermonema sp.]